MLRKQNTLALCLQHDSEFEVDSNGRWNDGGKRGAAPKKGGAGCASNYPDVYLFPHSQVYAQHIIFDVSHCS